MDRQIFVYVDLDKAPHLVGRLWLRVRNRTEGATFQYDPTWLKNPERFALEPALQMDAAPYHTEAGKRLFGAIGDSAPDRWGRALMLRAEARREKKQVTHRTLFGKRIISCRSMMKPVRGPFDLPKRRAAHSCVRS